jgi:ABC-2 type transport system ATP-binding protein
MWDLIDELSTDGTTTLLTTQYLEEAERLADAIVVIDRGTVIAEGTVDELKARTGGARLAVTVGGDDELDPTAAVLRDRRSGQDEPQVDRERRTVTISVSDTHAIVPAVVRLLDDSGIEVHDVVVRRPTLDDVFLQLTGHDTGAIAAEPPEHRIDPLWSADVDETLRELQTKWAPRPPRDGGRR